MNRTHFIPSKVVFYEVEGLVIFSFELPSVIEYVVLDHVAQNLENFRSRYFILPD